jgi:hypothetical protein
MVFHRGYGFNLHFRNIFYNRLGFALSLAIIYGTVEITASPTVNCSLTCRPYLMKCNDVCSLIAREVSAAGGYNLTPFTRFATIGTCIMFTELTATSTSKARVFQYSSCKTSQPQITVHSARTNNLRIGKTEQHRDTIAEQVTALLGMGKFSTEEEHASSWLVGAAALRLVGWLACRLQYRAQLCLHSCRISLLLLKITCTQKERI